MATKISTNPNDGKFPKFDGAIVLVIVSAGVANGAAGWGITPSGKVKKIPDNNPIGKRVIAAAQAAATPALRSPALAEIARVGLAEMADAARELAASMS